jgi:hypothetical protein
MVTKQFIAAVLQQATAQGSKSTVLRPLGWLAGICVTALLGCIRFKAPDWIGIPVLCFLGLTILLYLTSYVYCLLTDKEALRTETYLIQKTAIEKGVYGDSTLGTLIAEEPVASAQLLPPGVKDQQ